MNRKSRNDFIMGDCFVVLAISSRYRQCFEFFGRGYGVRFEPADSELAFVFGTGGGAIFVRLIHAFGHGGLAFEEGVTVVCFWVS